MNSQADVIIHIGPPKTATTTMQHFWFPELNSVVRFVGKPWFNPHVPYELCLRVHRAIDSISMTPSGEEFNDELVRQAVKDYAECLVRLEPRLADAPILISEERLVYEDIVDLSVLLDRLARCFPEATIFYVERNRIDVLASAYKWLFARDKTRLNFKQWVDAGLNNTKTASEDPGLWFKCCDYPRLSLTLKSRFSNIVKLEFDDVITCPHRQFSRVFGSRMDSVTCDASSIENSSEKQLSLMAHRWCKKSLKLANRIFFWEVAIKEEYISDNLFFKFLSLISPLFFNEEKIYSLSESMKSDIENYYRSVREPC